MPKALSKTLEVSLTGGWELGFFFNYTEKTAKGHTHKLAIYI